MIITNVKLQNWRNFRSVDVPLRERTYILGANASGKSNFLDVFRFLRDVSRPGGLEKAVADRGGMSKLRCLHARRPPDVAIEVVLAESVVRREPVWRYRLSFKAEGKGAQRTLITSEEVWLKDKKILSRPDKDDLRDSARLTQTHLQNTNSNASFRDIAEFLGEITYLHVVPQLLKYGDKIAGHVLEGDPFGQGFLERVAKATDRVRQSRLSRIERALASAIPQFRELRFLRDKVNGRPHLEARYAHFRPNAGWQREDQFSDGTLRLIGLLWSLLESDSFLLIEEPELSLNDGIVEQIPQMLSKVLKESKRQRQVLISTHSEALLSNPGIDGRGVLVLEPTSEETRVRSISQEEGVALESGFSVAEAVLPKTRPNTVGQLGMW